MCIFRSMLSMYADYYLNYYTNSIIKYLIDDTSTNNHNNMRLIVNWLREFGEYIKNYIIYNLLFKLSMIYV